MKRNFSIFSAAVLVVFVVGCGKKEAGPGKDWSGKPLKTVAGTVNKVAFTIDLPEQMKKDSASSELTMMWKADMSDYFSEPSAMVSYASIPAKNMADFKKYNFVGKKEVIAKEKELDGKKGFLLIHHTKNKGLLTVLALHFKDGKALSCRASQAKGGGVPNFTATMAWLEKICMSVKFK